MDDVVSVTAADVVARVAQDLIELSVSEISIPFWDAQLFLYRGSWRRVGNACRMCCSANLNSCASMIGGSELRWRIDGSVHEAQDPEGTARSADRK